MAEQESPSRRSQQRPGFDLSQVSFDPSRVRLPVLAAIGFAVGIFFHACVVFAVLGGDSDSTSDTAVVEQANDIVAVETVVQPTVTPTISPTGDRNNCNAIRGTDYRSATERQWFIENCSGT